MNDAMRAISRRLANAPHPEQFFEVLLVEITRTFSSRSAIVTLYDSDKDSFAIASVVHDGAVVPLDPMPSTIPRRQFAIWDRIVETQSPILLNTTTDREWHWPGGAEHLESLGASGCVIFPIRCGGDTPGLIAFSYEHPPLFTSDEQELVDVFCNQAAIALQTLRLSTRVRDAEAARAEEARQAAIARERETSARRHANELERANAALQRAIAGLAGLQDLGSFLEILLQACMDVAGAHSGTFALLTPEGVDQFVLRDIHGTVPRDRAIAEGIAVFPVTPSIARLCEEIVENPSSWAVRVDGAPNPDAMIAFHRRNGTRTIRCVPLLVGRRLLGWLGLGFAHDAVAADAHPLLLRLLAEQATAAIEMTRLAETAKAAAIASEHQRVLSERADQLQHANEAIRAMTARLLAEPSLDNFLGSLLSELARSLGSQAAWIATYDPARDCIEVAASMRDGVREPIGSVRWCISRKDVHDFDAVLETTGARTLTEHAHLLSSDATAWLRSIGATAWVTLAIRSEPTLLGQMAFAYPEVPVFDSVQNGLIEVFSHLAALALQLTRLAEEARQAAEVRAAITERNRMAGEIHDSLAQSFTSIVMQSESALAELEDASPVRPALELIEEIGRLGLAEARSSVIAMRPLGEEAGELERALSMLAARCNIEGSVRCEFRSGSSPARFGPDVRDGILRIAQEAVTNSLRHSGGSWIIIELRCEGEQASLTVEDNGVGIGSPPVRPTGGFGLNSMRTRASSLGAELRILTGDDGSGTKIELVFNGTGALA